MLPQPLKKSLSFLTLSVLTLSANAALYDRGNGLIYDDVQDITWLQDMNYAKTSSYDDDGRMNWSDAHTWVDQLSYGGFDDWRLPSAGPDAIVGYEDSSSELGYMYYDNLANASFGPGSPSPNVSFTDMGTGNAVSFYNVQPNILWYGEASVDRPEEHWAFFFDIGAQSPTSDSNEAYSWAVRDGDVALSEVPVPAAAWLFGSAILGLIGVKRKQH